VVIDDFDVLRTGSAPSKADPPLLVDADAVLTGAIAPQLLQSVTRRDPRVVECLRGVQDQQLAQRRSLLPRYVTWDDRRGIG